LKQLSQKSQAQSGIPLDAATQSKIWTTALVVAYLSFAFDSLKAEWELVADKSKSWIDKQLKTAGIFNSATLSSSTLVKKALETLKQSGTV